MAEPSLPHGEPQPPPPKAPILAYVVCLVVVVMVGVIGVLMITLLRPGEDNSQLIGTLVGMLTPTAGVIIVLIHNGAAIKEVHYSLNSRLSEYLALAKASSLAQGKEQMRAEMGGTVPVPPVPMVGVGSMEEGKLVVPIPIPVPTVVLVPTQENNEEEHGKA